MAADLVFEQSLELALEDFPNDDEVLLGYEIPTNSGIPATEDPEDELPEIDLSKIFQLSAFPAKDYVPKNIQEMAAIMKTLAEPISRELGGAPCLDVLKIALAFIDDEGGTAARRVKSPWNAYQQLFRDDKIKKLASEGRHLTELELKGELRLDYRKRKNEAEELGHWNTLQLEWIIMSMKCPGKNKNGSSERGASMIKRQMRKDHEQAVKLLEDTGAKNSHSSLLATWTTEPGNGAQDYKISCSDDLAAQFFTLSPENAPHRMIESAMYWTSSMKIKKEFLVAQSENWDIIKTFLRIPGEVQLEEAIKKALASGNTKRVGFALPATSITSGRPVENKKKREADGNDSPPAKRHRIVETAGNTDFTVITEASIMEIDDDSSSSLTSASNVDLDPTSNESPRENQGGNDEQGAEGGALAQAGSPDGFDISQIPEGSLDTKDYKIPKVNKFAFNSQVPPFSAPIPIPGDIKGPTLKSMTTELSTSRTSFPNNKGQNVNIVPVTKTQTDRQSEILLKFSQHPLSLEQKDYLVRLGAPKPMTAEDLPAPAQSVTPGASNSPPLLAGRVGSKAYIVEPAPLPAVPWFTARNTAISTDHRKERQRAAADLTAAACYRSTWNLAPSTVKASQAVIIGHPTNFLSAKVWLYPTKMDTIARWEMCSRFLAPHHFDRTMVVCKRHWRQLERPIPGFISYASGSREIIHWDGWANTTTDAEPDGEDTDECPANCALTARYLNEIVPALRKVYFDNEEQVVVCPELVFLAIDQPEIMGDDFTTADELLKQPFVQAYLAIHKRLQSQGFTENEHGFYLSSWRASYTKATDICVHPRNLTGLIADRHDRSLASVLTLNTDNGELCSSFNKGESPKNPTLIKLVVSDFKKIPQLHFDPSAVQEPGSQSIVPDSEPASTPIVNEQTLTDPTTGFTEQELEHAYKAIKPTSRTLPAPASCASFHSIPSSFPANPQQPGEAGIEPLEAGNEIPGVSVPSAEFRATATSLGPPEINILSATPQKPRARSAFVPLSDGIPRPRNVSVSHSDGGHSDISAASNPSEEMAALLEMHPWLKAVRSCLSLSKSKLRQVAFNSNKNFREVADDYYDRCFGFNDSNGTRKEIDFREVDIPIGLILGISGHRTPVAKVYAIPLIQSAVVQRYLSRRVQAEPEERWLLLREMIKWAGADEDPAGMFQLLSIGGKELITAIYDDSQTRFMKKPGEVLKSYKHGDDDERISIFSRMVEMENEVKSDNHHNLLSFVLAIGPATCQFTRELLTARSIPDIYKEPNSHAVLEEVLTDAFVDIPELEDKVSVFIWRFLFCDLTNFCLSKELIFPLEHDPEISPMLRNLDEDNPETINIAYELVMARFFFLVPENLRISQIAEPWAIPDCEALVKATLGRYVDSPEEFRKRAIDIARLARKALVYHHIRWLQLPLSSRGPGSCETARLERARNFTGRLARSLSKLTPETLEEFRIGTREHKEWTWEDLNLINVTKMC